MSKKLSLIVLSIVMIIVLAACGSGSKTESGDISAAAPAPAVQDTTGNTAEEPAAVDETNITITHEKGETTVKKNPEKVVVFDFGALDTLDKLGVEVAGVPQANIPPYLSKYEDAKYANVGSLKEPDFEKINAIEPDLILISGRQGDAYEELNKIAPTIYIGVDNSRYMESFTENMYTLGLIFGKEEAVEQELASLEQSINELHETASASGENALVILANEGAISAYGAGSRFGIIHEVFGFTPVDDNIEVSTHGMSVSFEYITEKDPDYLFVIDRGATVEGGDTTAKQLLENDLVKNTKAYQNDNIVYLDPNYWYLSGGGLISVSEMVKEIAEGAK
ncbi:siderophore ABC transporter substrate-binding protein [Paenibacillus abyssi]|uniref:Iron ABC transporter substrate-binding protein n=1 Tax=Paenibacillus abyssi TaxID=1340531 RepID=A0A917CMX7_9BACL|nr:siderophore ABC transporter substrate-binding protein [Paenibacillus abyssi]GGF92941.1 iron ABC transporter substrate-binding protein [Paenibacillus abyssi]